MEMLDGEIELMVVEVAAELTVQMMVDLKMSSVTFHLIDSEILIEYLY